MSGTRIFLCGLGIVLLGLFQGIPALRAQDKQQEEDILVYEFEDEAELEDFFHPGVVDLCGDLYPIGSIEIDNGELLMTNHDVSGISLFSLYPNTVAEIFPEGSRDYRVRVLVNLESINEMLIYLRGRVGVFGGPNPELDASLERGYACVLLPEGTDGEFFDGALAITEFSACHQPVPHREWPNAAPGFARADPGFPIIPGEWYWVEVSAQGNDNGGPVQISMKVWEEDEDPPEEPQLQVIDTNGLNHNRQTLDDATNVEVLFGASFDFAQQPGATCRFDDLTITLIGGCRVPPVEANRTLWEERVEIEGEELAVYDDGEEYPVVLTLSRRRGAGVCERADLVTITETVPPQWEITSVGQEGQAIEDNIVRWEFDLSAGNITELTYSVIPDDSGTGSFMGEITEPENDFAFVVSGESDASSRAGLAPVSDFGSIQNWLVLGPFTREGGANPGEEEIIRDYLTDGETSETEIVPVAALATAPDYNGASAATGLAPNDRGRNPDDVPTWIEWFDRDDDDDRIDFDTIYGGNDNVMCYAVSYLDVKEEIEVHLGVSSDDSIQLFIDGQSLHVKNASRGALDRLYQDTAFEYPDLGNIILEPGRHTLMVKVFDGGGEHNFRVGFLDEFGIEIPGGPEDLSISTRAPEAEPEERFKRGDTDGNGALQLTDGIRILNTLFMGAAMPVCLDAADTDDNGVVQLTDGIVIFQFLFVGGMVPAEPGPFACGGDPTDDDIDCEAYDGC